MSQVIKFNVLYVHGKKQQWAGLSQTNQCNCTVFVNHRTVFYTAHLTLGISLFCFYFLLFSFQQFFFLYLLCSIFCSSPTILRHSLAIYHDMLHMAIYLNCIIICIMHSYNWTDHISQLYNIISFVMLVTAILNKTQYTDCCIRVYRSFSIPVTA